MDAHSFARVTKANLAKLLEERKYASDHKTR